VADGCMCFPSYLRRIELMSTDCNLSKSHVLRGDYLSTDFYIMDHLTISDALQIEILGPPRLPVPDDGISR
jgi:hypothetical protein